MTTCIARTPGLSGYKIDRCRCPDCTAANRDYTARRNRQIAYGRWDPFVDAQPIRDHIATLRAAGIGTRRIADLTGVAIAAVSALTWGRNGRPRRKVRHRTAAAILALQPSDGLLAPAALTDNTGTRRRIQALAAIGWPLTRIGERIGMSPENVGALLKRPTVQSRTATKVAAVYRAMAGAVPPDTPATRRCRQAAARKGWHSPAAWSGETIDDPAAEPELDTGDPLADIVDDVLVERVLNLGIAQPVSPANRARAIELGRRRGMPLSAIGLRLRVSHDTVRRLSAQVSAT